MQFMTDPIYLEQVDPELAQAIAKLQRANKKEIYPAIKLCLEFYSKYYYLS